MLPRVSSRCQSRRRCISCLCRCVELLPAIRALDVYKNGDKGAENLSKALYDGLLDLDIEMYVPVPSPIGFPSGRLLQLPPPYPVSQGLWGQARGDA